MTYRHLSDRRRVELILIIGALRDIVKNGANPDPETDRCMGYLDTALTDALRDRPSITDRAARAYGRSIGASYVAGAQVDAIGLAVYHWLKVLTEADYFQKGDDDLGKAIDMILPAIEHATERDGTMDHARDVARAFFAQQQTEGYFPGIDFDAWVDDGS